MLTPLELPVSSHTSLADTTGYLLEYTGHVNQAKALESFVERAESIKLLDPSIKPMSEALGELYEHKKDEKWALEINEPVELDF